jgi:hypothetical protein
VKALECRGALEAAGGGVPRWRRPRRAAALGRGGEEGRTRGGMGCFIGARGGFTMASLEQRREVTAGSSTYGEAGSAGRGGPARRRRGAWRARTTSCLGVIPASGRVASGSTARMGKARATSEGVGRECPGQVARDVAS